MSNKIDRRGIGGIMRVSISQASIDQLKDQVNIVDVIGRTVNLKKAGANYKGLCPFHNEKTPSFSVSETRQFFNCFGCGARGDVISFVRRYYNLEFTEAVEKIADEYGIRLEKKGSQGPDLAPFYEANRLAARFFYETLTSGPNSGYEYMIGRGISPRTMKKFGIGYADERWDSLLKHLESQGVEEKIMRDLGLVSESRGRIYDRFRNRVIFPIINTSGKVIGFGGRALDPDAPAKYLNSPESRIFQKKNHLYALNLTRKSMGEQGFAILVEGYMDVVSLYQNGIGNVAASLGTALTSNQARLLHRYTDDVVLSYDADRAGRQAALRGIEILRNEDCRVRVLHVTDGKDPDEYVKKNGKDAYLELVRHALPYADYRLESAADGLDMESSEGRVAFVKAAADIIRSLDPAEQAEYIRKVSEALRISVAAVTGEIRKLEKNDKKNAGRPRGDDEQRRALSEDLTSVEQTLIKLCLTDSEYIEKVKAYDGLLKSEFAVKMIGVAEKTGGSEISDPGLIEDTLTEEESALLNSILENVRIDLKQKERVFRECINKWKAEKLAERERELIAVLSMADESRDEEQIRALTVELLSVQKEKRKLTD